MDLLQVPKLSETTSSITIKYESKKKTKNFISNSDGELCLTFSEEKQIENICIQENPKFGLRSALDDFGVNKFEGDILNEIDINS